MLENFSVLMPVYFGERLEFLSEAVRSILDQTLLPSQLVIVCDGPIREDCDAFLQNLSIGFELTILRLPNNVGLGRALQVGLESCSNDIVVRVDSDDVSLNNRFVSLVTLMSCSPELAVVGSYIREFNFRLDLLRKVPLAYSDIKSFSRFRNPFNHMSVAFRKSLVFSVGGYEHCPGYEDYYLWLKVLKRYECMNIPEVLVFARTGEDFFKRRGGYVFFKKELFFLYKSWRAGFLSVGDVILNTILRAAPRLLPVFLIKRIYNCILRVR